jgi:hypothetical protein
MTGKAKIKHPFDMMARQIIPLGNQNLVLLTIFTATARLAKA